MKVKSLPLLLLMLILLSGCYYDDGPIVSLRTPEKRLVNKWRYSYVTVNGTDVTKLYKNFYMEFKKDNTAAFFFKDLLIDNAKWKFSDDYRYIYLSFAINNNELKEEFYILKLKKEELWLKNDSGGISTYYELVAY